MALSPMQLIRGLPYQLDKVQQNASNTFSQLNNNLFINGNMIQNISITSGTPVNINTGLGVPLQIWIVVRNNSNSVIWESSSTDSNILVLNASASTTISIWVG